VRRTWSQQRIGPTKTAATMLSWNAPLLYVQQQGGWRSATVLLRTYARWLPQPAATQAQPAAPAVAMTATPNLG
jgi:hypothetical protein